LRVSARSAVQVRSAGLGEGGRGTVRTEVAEEVKIAAKPARALKRKLEKLYAKYNRAEFVHPDPLEYLHSYDDVRDREIVALVASSLAYGRVAQILRSVARVLKRLEAPGDYVRGCTQAGLRRDFKGFKHRFTTGDDVALMLLGARRLIERHGSLENAFCSGLNDSEETVLPALCSFTSQLNSSVGVRRSSLVPMGSSGSACKRLNLFLRWMVRRDRVDPGGWDKVPRSKLIVPLDVHMHRLSLAMGLTGRKQANMRAALEATAAFRAIMPDDPVRYDFSLTRLGIREELEISELLADGRGPAKVQYDS
jgi:uncharacterized protein (TIGR02757 family)